MLRRLNIQSSAVLLEPKPASNTLEVYSPLITLELEIMPKIIYETKESEPLQRFKIQIFETVNGDRSKDPLIPTGNIKLVLSRQTTRLEYDCTVDDEGYITPQVGTTPLPGPGEYDAELQFDVGTTPTIAPTKDYGRVIVYPKL